MLRLNIFLQYGFVFPEDYRWFLINVGNGGAGPHYGLHRVEIDKAEYYCTAHIPARIPTKEDADKLELLEDERQREKCYDEFFSGMIVIGTQLSAIILNILLMVRLWIVWDSGAESSYDNSAASRVRAVLFALRKLQIK